ncbi:MAG: hypothetical protein JWN99_1256, partial [Ilumatobacteraceae bacterium]|nr:hypothetical protein [Ilumatobacteraceae bacterium]
PIPNTLCRVCVAWVLLSRNGRTAYWRLRRSPLLLNGEHLGGRFCSPCALAKHLPIDSIS